MQRQKTYFECLGEDLANVLFAQVTSGAETILDLCLFAASLGRTTSGARTDGATEHLWSPPPVDGTLRMMEAEYRVGVGESPRVRRLGETRDDVQGGEREGGTRRSRFGGWRTGGVRRDDAGANGGGDRFHAATVLDT